MSELAIFGGPKAVNEEAISNSIPKKMKRQ